MRMTWLEGCGNLYDFLFPLVASDITSVIARSVVLRFYLDVTNIPIPLCMHCILHVGEERCVRGMTRLFILNGWATKVEAV